MKSKTFMPTGRVSPSFQVRLTFLSSKNGITCHASCPLGYTKQSHCMYAPIGKNFGQHFGTLSRVKYSRHPQWESRNPMSRKLDNSSERVLNE